MSALAKSDFVPWSLSEAVLSDLVRKGAYLFDAPLDPKACAALLAEIRATRRFDSSLFLDEAAFASSRVEETRPGRNLLDRLDSRLGFVERAPQIVEALWSLLGPDYRILDKQVVCALPASAVPAWVRRRVQAGSAESLSAYVRPEFRDLAYAWADEFHQDLDAAGDCAADVVTLHVYLHPVAEAEGALHLLAGSHRMGPTAFPHDLKKTGADSWRYRTRDQGEMYLTERSLAGEAGFAVLWHACALNAAAPPADQPRLSLRYRIARGEARSAGIDAVNASLAKSSPRARD
jgi:hypothetical protein